MGVGLHNRLNDLLSNLELPPPEIEDGKSPDLLAPGIVQNIIEPESTIVQEETLVLQPEANLGELPSHPIGPELIQGLITQLIQADNFNQRLDLAAQSLGKILAAQTITAFLFDSARGTQKIVAEYSSHSALIPGIGMEIPLNFLSDLLLEKQGAIIIQIELVEPETRPFYNLMKAQGVESRAIFPIRRQNEVIGSLNIDLAKKYSSFSADDIHLIEFITRQI